MDYFGGNLCEKEMGVTLMLQDVYKLSGIPISAIFSALIRFTWRSLKAGSREFGGVLKSEETLLGLLGKELNFK